MHSSGHKSLALRLRTAAVSAVKNWAWYHSKSGWVQPEKKSLSFIVDDYVCISGRLSLREKVSANVPQAELWGQPPWTWMVCWRHAALWVRTLMIDYRCCVLRNHSLVSQQSRKNLWWLWSMSHWPAHTNTIIHSLYGPSLEMNTKGFEHVELRRLRPGTNHKQHFSQLNISGVSNLT